MEKTTIVKILREDIKYMIERKLGVKVLDMKLSHRGATVFLVQEKGKF